MKALTDAEAVREVSVVTLTEIAIKRSRGKLGFEEADCRKSIEDLQLRVLPYTLNHAMGMFALPRHHDDPFDRQLIAQALAENIPVVTCDQQFGAYKGLRVIW